jgi:hypothetical protein
MFYGLVVLFGLFVLFLYGPIATVAEEPLGRSG